MKQWYEELFENYAEGYDRESFTQGTVQEADFTEQVIGHGKSPKVLDVGCGTGRHSVELAKRGYMVTGVDLSESLLDRARQKAAAAGVKVTFLRQDGCTPGQFSRQKALTTDDFEMLVIAGC
jgi:ubiquinone/menaquinone biosynthesis C-methylase UbiE